MQKKVSANAKSSHAAILTLQASEEAKDFEQHEKWEEALSKYEEAAKLNCNYDYSDQRQISRKIDELNVKAGRTEDGSSILNNVKTILADYSKYRYVRENPVYVNRYYL